MFHKKRRKSMMGMDWDMDMDMGSMLKAVALGAVIYQAARFMLHDMTDD